MLGLGFGVWDFGFGGGCDFGFGVSGLGFFDISGHTGQMCACVYGTKGCAYDPKLGCLLQPVALQRREVGRERYMSMCEEFLCCIHTEKSATISISSSSCLLARALVTCKRTPHEPARRSCACRCGPCSRPAARTRRPGTTTSPGAVRAPPLRSAGPLSASAPAAHAQRPQPRPGGVCLAPSTASAPQTPCQPFPSAGRAPGHALAFPRRHVAARGR